MSVKIATGTAVLIATCALGGGATQTSAAQAATSASITPLLSPNRLGARADLTFTIAYSGGAFGVPAPVRRSIVMFPAGLSIDVPTLRSCTAARLRARGPRGCPAKSQIGGGHALAEARAGSQTIAERFVLSAFLGPPQGNQPTVEILGQGRTPFDERVVLSGTVSPDRAPYGEELAMSIPPIHTVPFEPDASMVIFSLTLGASTPTREANTLVVPALCPAGGFPFAAEFTYADGSSDSALATAPCPL